MPPTCSEHALLVERIQAACEGIARIEAASEARGKAIGELHEDVRELRRSLTASGRGWAVLAQALRPDCLRWLVALVLSVAVAIGAVSVADLAGLQWLPISDALPAAAEADTEIGPVLESRP